MPLSLTAVRRLLIAIPIALSALVVGGAGAQPAPTRVLFIGNSLTFWNDGLWTHFERMNSQAQPPVAVTTGRSVFPGAFFKSLWERPEPREAIRSRRYDVVVLQEDLPETRIEDFRDHARRFVAEVRQAGARPILLMAWAYPRLGWITMAEIARAHREHPSIYGTYLATAVVYATIFGTDPSPLTYSPAGMATDDAAFLRRVAWEVALQSPPGSR